MTVSGIVVACRPENLAKTAEAVRAFSWAEVHYTDPGGRLVVTIVARDVEEGMRRLAEIQRLPRVLVAELAEFVVDEEDDRATKSGDGAEAERGSLGGRTAKPADALRRTSRETRRAKAAGGDDGPEPT